MLFRYADSANVQVNVSCMKNINHIEIQFIYPNVDVLIRECLHKFIMNVNLISYIFRINLINNQSLILDMKMDNQNQKRIIGNLKKEINHFNKTNWPKITKYSVFNKVPLITKF